MRGTATNPEKDAVLTMAPPPPVTMAASSDRRHRKTPVRFTARTLSHSDTS